MKDGGVANGSGRDAGAYVAELVEVESEDLEVQGGIDGC